MEGIVQALALLSSTINFSLPSALPQPRAQQQSTHSGTRDWVPPKLTYDARSGCPPVYERRVAGFGVIRVRLGCINGTIEAGRGQ